MTTTTPRCTNPQLALDTLAAIEADPASHDQDVWARKTACGTKYCFAGHAVRLSGGRFYFEADAGGTLDASCVYLNSLPESVQVELADVVDDRGLVWVDRAAEELLGISRDDAEALFIDTYHLAGVRRFVAELTATEGTS